MSSILKQYESLVFIVKLNLFSTNFYCFQLFLLNSIPYQITCFSPIIITIYSLLLLFTFLSFYSLLLTSPIIIPSYLSPSLFFVPFPSPAISAPSLQPISTKILSSITESWQKSESWKKKEIMKKNLHFCFIQSHNSYSPHTSMITKTLEITARFSRFVFLFFSFHIFIKKRHIPMAFIDPSNKFFDNDDYAYNSIAKARIN